MTITKSINKLLNKRNMKTLLNKVTNKVSNLNDQNQYLEDAKKWSDSNKRILNCSKYHLENTTRTNFDFKIKLIESLFYISERCNENTILNAKKAGLNLKNLQ